MVADGDAVELDLAPFAASDANQREIGRAAADVANQDLLARLDQSVPVVGVGVNPGVEGRLRLFDQHDARQAGQRRRLHRQLAGHFIERGRQGQHEILLGQRMTRKSGVPGVAHVGEIPRADLDRREPIDVGRPLPRQQRRRPIHARVTQPRFRRVDQPARRQRALVAGEEADRVVRLFFLPRAFQRSSRCQLARGRLIMERGERLPRFDLSRGDHLRNGKRLDLPRLFRGVDVGRPPSWWCPGQNRPRSGSRPGMTNRRVSRPISLFPLQSRPSI